jgi:hypothetical protein
MEAVGRRDDAVAMHVLTHLHKGNPRGQDALLRLEAGLGCCPTHLQSPDGADGADCHQTDTAGLWSMLRPLNSKSAATDSMLQAHDVDAHIDGGASRPAGSHHSLTRTNSGELWMELVKHSGGGSGSTGGAGGAGEAAEGEAEDEPKAASWAADEDGEGDAREQRRPWRPTLPGRQIHPLALRRRHLCRVYRAARWKLQRLLHKSKLRAWLSVIKGYNSPPRQVGLRRPRPSVGSCEAGSVERMQRAQQSQGGSVQGFSSLLKPRIACTTHARSARGAAGYRGTTAAWRLWGVRWAVEMRRVVGEKGPSP